MRSVPIHYEQGRVFRRQIGEARLHAPLNVEDTEVDRDAPLCIRPKATRHWLAAVVVVRPPARWTVVRSHVLIVLAGVYDVVGEDEETRKVKPVRGRATPNPVPSPQPLLTITSPQSPSVPITVRFPLALEAVVASFVRRVSSMLKMRPGLVILMGCKSSSPSTKAVLRTAKPSFTIMVSSRL